MPIPTPEALRHRAAARRWARSGEWGFTAASSAVNVTVVAAAGGSFLRILLAGLAPIVLAAMSHLLTKVLQSELMVSGVHGVVNLAVAGAVTLIGGGAFALSFDMLRRAAEPDHGELAWIFPVTLDLAIVVSAGVLAVIAWADEQDQRTSAAAKQPPVLRAEPAATHLGDAAVLRDVSADEPATVTVPVRDADPAPVATQTAPVRDVEPSEPAAHTATQESVLRDADTVEILLTSGASREAAPVRREVEAPKRRLAAVPAAVRDVDDEPAASRSSDLEVPATQTDPVRDVVREGPATQPAAVRDAERVDSYLLRAQQLVDAGRTNADLEVVRRVLHGKANRISNRELADELGISESAVQRMVKADRELAGASA